MAECRLGGSPVGAQTAWERDESQQAMRIPENDLN